MSTKVTLNFVTDDPDLQDFLHAVISSHMLNSHDNEEGQMINLWEFQYQTEPA